MSYTLSTYSPGQVVWEKMSMVVRVREWKLSKIEPAFWQTTSPAKRQQLMQSKVLKGSMKICPMF